MEPRVLKPRIVVADDDELIRGMVAARLSAAGFDVVQASDGPAALEAVKGLKPALLILDWQMPDMDGLAVLRRMQRNPEMAKTPVLMLTARGRPQDVREALDFGATAYMVKPFEVDDLLARVQRMARGAGVVWPR